MEQIWKVAVYSATTHPLIKHFPKQIPKWGNCEFILNSGSEDCDCLFVIDSILGDIPVKCGKENTFYVFVSRLLLSYIALNILINLVILFHLEIFLVIKEIPFLHFHYCRGW